MAVGWRVLLLLCAGALAVSAATGSPARADGCYVNRGGLLKPPRIPAQRALVVYRDGVERLVVESTLDAEGQSFGWILPVPAPPTHMEAVSPAILDTLDLATRPHLVTQVNEEALGVGIFGVLLFLVAVTMSRRRERRAVTPARAVLRVLALLAMVGLSLAMLIPNLMSSHLGMGPIAVPGAESGGAQRIGNYDVEVVRSRHGRALGDWLRAADLAPLPRGGAVLADAYAAEGWVFVVARLRREGGGAAAPHPQSLEFPCAAPVYPMRLTALAGGSTDLRLHVVADGAAFCRPLRVGFAGRFRRSTEPVASVWGSDAVDLAVHDGAPGGARGVAYPALRDLMWDGCSVTRLEGTVPQRRMLRDMQIEVAEEREVVRVLHTSRAASWAAVRTVVPWWALSILLLALVPQGGLPSLGARGDGYPRWGVLCTLLCVAAAAGARSRMETVPGDRVVWTHSFRSTMSRIPAELQASGLASPYTAGQLREALGRTLARKALRNPVTGAPLGEGDGPGDVLVEEGPDGPVLRIRTLEGAALDVEGLGDGSGPR